MVPEAMGREEIQQAHSSSTMDDGKVRTQAECNESYKSKGERRVGGQRQSSTPRHSILKVDESKSKEDTNLLNFPTNIAVTSKNFMEYSSDTI